MPRAASPDAQLQAALQEPMRSPHDHPALRAGPDQRSTSLQRRLTLGRTSFASHLAEKRFSDIQPGAEAPQGDAAQQNGLEQRGGTHAGVAFGRMLRQSLTMRAAQSRMPEIAEATTNESESAEAEAAVPELPSAGVALAEEHSRSSADTIGNASTEAPGAPSHVPDDALKWAQQKVHMASLHPRPTGIVRKSAAIQRRLERADQSCNTSPAPKAGGLRSAGALVQSQCRKGKHGAASRVADNSDASNWLTVQPDALLRPMKAELQRLPLLSHDALMAVQHSFQDAAEQALLSALAADSIMCLRLAHARVPV